MTFGRGDVVYRADPFKGEDGSRPWVVISTDSHPFQGDQHIVLGLTTRTWHEGLVAIEDDDWLDGGTPEESSIIPWSAETIEHVDIEFRQGRLSTGRLETAVTGLISVIRVG